MRKRAVRILAYVLSIAVLSSVIPWRGGMENVSAAEIPEEPVRKMELNMGSMTENSIKDEANNIDLEASNITKAESGFPSLGDTAYFSGTSESYIQVGQDHLAYKFKRWDQYTVSMWIKPETIKWSTLFANYKEGQPYDTVQVYLDHDATVRAEIFGYTKPMGQYSASKLLISNTKLKAGDWAHIALVRDGRQYTLYINGKADVSDTFSEDVYSVTSPEPDPIGFLIGARINADQSVSVPYHGYMDAFKIYDTALSEDMISSMFNQAEILPVLKFKGAAQAPQSKLSLWYRSPAQDWEQEALPLGNGYMGSKVFGGVEEEVIQFNDVTLWKGGPDSDDRATQTDNPFGLNQTIGDPQPHLEKMREMLDNGDPLNAQKYLRENMLGAQGDNGYGCYQNFGEVHFDYNLAGEHTITDYRRELDIENAVSRVEYQLDGVKYKREYFMSYPDRVMVMKLSADQPMKKLGISQWSAHSDALDFTHTAQGDTITVSGGLKDNGERFAAQLKLLSTDGAYGVNGTDIQVENAKEIVLLLSTATDYSSEYPVYRSGVDPMIPLTETINKASQKTYEELYQAHLADYHELFNRVQLDLGNEKPEIPTDELIDAYQIKATRPLEVLFYQYGRYLMIAGSRPNSLPVNLQGIWNNSNSPIWGSDYHYNVNFQMNYWPAEVANLSECAEPMIDFIDALRPSGRVTASTYYGVGNGTDPVGWSVNCTGNIFGYTTVGTQLSWAWGPAGNAFISQNIWEHFDFNRDMDYLENKIYPIIKEAALFWLDWLVEDTDGTLVSSPSYSPEQMHIAKAPAYDQQLAWELFTNVIEASEILGVDEELRQVLIQARDKLSPVEIGDLGQIKEWKEWGLDTPNRDSSIPRIEGEPDGLDGEQRHRHLSHLVGLYPGKQINRDTPELLEAASIALDRRGTEQVPGSSTKTTGWSTAWKINARARTYEGDIAHELLSWQLRNHTADNLWDTHDAHDIFQIEGNFGAAAGVSEMLIQSHMDYIDLLPALPKAWADGSVQGLRARGAYTVDQHWQGGILTNASISAENDGTIRVRSNDFIQKEYLRITDSHGEEIPFSLEDHIVAFEGYAGQTYTIENGYQAPFYVTNTTDSVYITAETPFSCTTELSNQTGQTQEVHVFLAAYQTDSENTMRLESVSMDTAEVPDGETKYVTLTQEIPSDINGYEVRCFVWGADSYSPIFSQTWTQDPVEKRIYQIGAESIILPVHENHMMESGVGAVLSIRDGVFVGWSQPAHSGSYHTVSWNVHVETAGYYLPTSKIGSDGQSMLVMTADGTYKAYTPIYGKSWGETDYNMGVIYLPEGDYKIEMERTEDGNWAGQFRDITLTLLDAELTPLTAIEQEADGRLIIHPGKDSTGTAALLKGDSVHDTWRILLYNGSTAIYKIHLENPQTFQITYGQAAGEAEIPLNITAHVLGSGKDPAVTTTNFTGQGEWGASAALTGGILDLSDAEPGIYYIQINSNSPMANIMDGIAGGSGASEKGIVLTPVTQ